MNNDSLLALILAALTFGIKHGFDLDHLATIDAITRTVRDHRYLSKAVGFLFSLGHGLVVILISMIIGGGLIQAHTPQWLEGFGSCISIGFLLLFGGLNLWSMYHDPSNSEIPVGIKSFIAKKISNKKASPAWIILVGALFAFSFDTFSQAALFSLSASLIDQWVLSGILGFFFMLGMMISDGLNGLLVSTLIQRADGASLVLSRGLGLAISLFSLVIGAIGLVNILFY